MIFYPDQACSVPGEINIAHESFKLPGIVDELCTDLECISRCSNIQSTIVKLYNFPSFFCSMFLSPPYSWTVLYICHYNCIAFKKNFQSDGLFCSKNFKFFGLFVDPCNLCIIIKIASFVFLDSRILRCHTSSYFVISF